MQQNPIEAGAKKVVKFAAQKRNRKRELEKPESVNFFFGVPLPFFQLRLKY